MERIAEAGAGFASVTEISTPRPLPGRMICRWSLVCRFERAMIRERTQRASLPRAPRAGRRPPAQADRRTAGRYAKNVFRAKHRGADGAAVQVSQPTVQPFAGRASPCNGGGQWSRRGKDGATPDRSRCPALAALGRRVAIVGTRSGAKPTPPRAGRTAARGGCAGLRRGSLGVWWGCGPVLTVPRQAIPWWCSVPPRGHRTRRKHGRCPRSSGRRAHLACVVDLSELGSSAGRRRFMTAFAEACMRPTPNRSIWCLTRPICGRRAAVAGSHTLLGRIEEIVRPRPGRGFIPWLITQRPRSCTKMYSRKPTSWWP